MSRKYLIAGNWKMNVTASESDDLVSEINSIVGCQTQVQVCICPPFTSLHRASALVEQSEVSLEPRICLLSLQEHLPERFRLKC